MKTASHIVSAAAKMTPRAGTTLFGGALKFNSIFGLAQIISTGTKHFGSCKRTRHKAHTTASRDRL